MSMNVCWRLVKIVVVVLIQKGHSRVTVQAPDIQETLVIWVRFFITLGPLYSIRPPVSDTGQFKGGPLSRKMCG